MVAPANPGGLFPAELRLHGTLRRAFSIMSGPLRPHGPVCASRCRAAADWSVSKLYTVRRPTDPQPTNPLKSLISPAWHKTCVFPGSSSWNAGARLRDTCSKGKIKMRGLLAAPTLLKASLRACTAIIAMAGLTAASAQTPGQPFTNIQPSLALTEVTPTGAGGNFPSFTSGGALGDTDGFIYNFAGDY